MSAGKREGRHRNKVRNKVLGGYKFHRERNNLAGGATQLEEIKKIFRGEAILRWLLKESWGLVVDQGQWYQWKDR